MNAISLWLGEQLHDARALLVQGCLKEGMIDFGHGPDDLSVLPVPSYSKSAQL